jgi:hypothetical protein
VIRRTVYPSDCNTCDPEGPSDEPGAISLQLESKHIELSRRFRDLDEKELESSESLAMGSSLFSKDPVWADLNKHLRVLIIAEAGSGKTWEMKEQARQLTDLGEAAFFLPVESLDSTPLADLLSLEDEARFDAWKADETARGWFYLDAVDELKLTDGKLDRALLRFAKALGPALPRAHVLLSCRPNDWRPKLDLATFLNHLPLTSEAAAPAPVIDPKEAFLEPLRRQRSKVPKVETPAETPVAPVRTVILLPLSAVQIRRYAEQVEVPDVDAFLEEIERQNAWDFARRPLDLSDLVSTWTAFNRLGTRREQHEANVVAKLRDNPDRRDQGLLSEDELRLDAERLALALILSKKRTLRSPDQDLSREAGDAVLDPAQILTDRSEKQRQTLLRRALFDPATYGRIRFHHRSVQEYLAACRLRHLRKRGMTQKALGRLLFADLYDEQIVLPSMRAIAAWLALDDAAVRAELVRREPEALLSLGDPESLRLEDRISLLESFASNYGKGGWRGLNIPWQEVRRLAHPELAATVRRIWLTAPENPDVRELLLELIWQGRLADCADLAEQDALNPALSANIRAVAIRALAACEAWPATERVRAQMMADLDAWPLDVRRELVVGLFPGHLPIDEMIEVLRRSPEERFSTSGFSWSLRVLVRGLDPALPATVALREGLAGLIWSGRTADSEVFHLKSEMIHLAPALAMLCAAQSQVPGFLPDDAWFRATAIALKFGKDQTGIDDAEVFLAQVLVGDLRRGMFRASLALLNDMKVVDSWNRYFYATHNLPIDPITQADRPWLEASLTGSDEVIDPKVALQALVRLWIERGRPDMELETLKGLIAERPELLETFAADTAPPKPNPSIVKMEKEHAARLRQSEAKEATRLHRWLEWRDKLVENPSALLRPEEELTTISNIGKWLHARSSSHSSYCNWDQPALDDALGADAGALVNAAFRRFWRRTWPVLWAARPAGERNSTLYTWTWALSGVCAESEEPGWADKLSHLEACLAFGLATLELNGLAPYAEALAKAHPEAARDVLGWELDREVRQSREELRPPLLQNLASHSGIIPQLMAPTLLLAVRAWASAHLSGIALPSESDFDDVLKILIAHGSDQDRSELLPLALSRYVDEPAGPLALTWLRAVMRIDFKKGAEVFLAHGGDPTVEEGRDAMLIAFATLFRGKEDLTGFSGDDEKAETLSALVRLAYTVVRQEDDVRHEGAYSPGTRDHAETGRNVLLSALLATPGPVASAALRRLSTDPAFSHFPDRLRMMARERAANDAENPALSSEELKSLEKNLEAPPHDRAGLFAVMMDRLEDLQHDIAHHAFTDRSLLQKTSQEIDLQRTLALRLEGSARDAFLMVRESEVADLKKTDIGIAAVRPPQKAVIEIKVGDSWSVAELERALSAQIKGQYLRHKDCGAGCLLVTHHKPSRRWRLKGVLVPFDDLIVHLKGYAKTLVEAETSDIQLAVFGLDLTNPPLEPAHG